MAKHGKSWLLGCALLAACSTTEPQAPELSEGAKALRIADFEIAETEHTLVIRGLDAGGVEVGRIDLTVGTYVDEINGDGEVYGRKLIVDVHGRQTMHTSPGTVALQLPLAKRSPQLQAFVLDPQVTSVLSRWGVGFDLTPADVEFAAVAEQASSCYFLDAGPGSFLSIDCSFSGCETNGPSYGCKEFDPGGNTIGEYRCCANGNAAERRCLSPYGATECGTAGPGGCAVCWVETGTSYCAAYIDEWEYSSKMSYCD